MQLLVGEQQGAAKRREVEPLERRAALERSVEEVEAVDVDVCALHLAGTLSHRAPLRRQAGLAR